MGTFSKNPNPILRAGKDGTIIFANSAASPLLEKWKSHKGEKFPPDIVDVVQKALLKKSPELLELSAGERTYSFSFHPFPEEACVNLYGFDITERVLENDKLRKRCEDLENRLENNSFVGGDRKQKSGGLPGHEGKKLQNTVRFLETLLDTIPVPVLYKDKNLRYLGCNELFAKQVIGLPKADILGKTLPELQQIRGIITEKEELFHGPDQAFPNKGKPDLIETEFLCADGITRDFLVSRAAFRDETEEAVFMVAVMLDVTELRHVETDLRNNLKFLETLLDNIPNPIFHRDINGNYINCNEKFASLIMGLSKGEITGSSVFDFHKTIPDTLADLYMDHDRELILEGGSQYSETEVMCTDGVKRNFLFSKAAYRGDFGDVAGVVGVMIDITERKLAEELLQRSKESYHIIMEQTERLVFDSDLVAKKIEWEGAIEKITGYGPDEFRKLDRNAWVKQIHPEDRMRMIKAINRSIETGDKFNEEFRFKRKDGNYIYVEYGSVYLKNKDGSVFRALGVIKDVTERKLNQEQIEKSEEKYRIVAEQTGQVVYDYNLLTEKIEWAGAVKAITGYDFEDIQAVDFNVWMEYIHPEDLNRALEKHYEAMETCSYHEIYRLRKKDGSYFYAEDSGVYLKDEMGRVCRMLGVIKDITESKLNQKKLEESEERFRIASEQTGQIVYDCNVETGKIELAGAIKALTGYDPEEVLALNVSNWTKNVHPEDRGRALDIHSKARKNGSHHHEEYRFRRKDGSYFYAEDSGVFLKNEKGKIYRLFGVIKDITERKLARINLEESEERLRVASEETGQIVFEHDFLKGTIKRTGAITELTGYSVEEFQSSNEGWIDHIHPEDRERVVEEFKKYWKDADRFRVEYRFRRKDGSYFYLEDSGIYRRDEKGKIIKALGVMKDITTIKLATDKLRESEARYRSFIDNFKGIAFQVDMDFTPTFMHGALEEITGYREEDFLSGNIFWHQLIDPEDLPVFNANGKKLKLIQDTFIEKDYRIRKKDGELRWVREAIQNVPLGCEGKRVLEGTIYDITEKKEVEENFAKIQEIRKKEIHHRIKNNLQVISSLLELEAEKFEDSAVVEAFRESQNRVISMSMIHEELYKSRDMETIDFEAYLRKLTSDLLKSYKIGGETVLLKLSVEDIFLRMDTAIPLGIVVNELVSNSLKHAFSEGREGEIYIKLCQMDDYGNKRINNMKSNINKNRHSERKNQYILIVSDNGLGFPENVDFRNTDSLGLQLVNALVDQLEGSIELDIDGKTEFRINFLEDVSITPH